MTVNKTILTVLGAALIAASTISMASAAEHHHVRKPDRAPVSDAFRRSNNFAAQPEGFAVRSPDWDTAPSYDGHAISPPAGR